MSVRKKSRKEGTEGGRKDKKKKTTGMGMAGFCGTRIPESPAASLGGSGMYGMILRPLVPKVPRPQPWQAHLGS